MRIQVVLHHDRLRPGALTVLPDAGGAALLGPVPCLGRADNEAAALHGNPDRDPKRSFGDTPTGEYRVAKTVPHSGETDIHSYGAHPSLLLDPQTGDALLAKQAKREGLMIHGGAPSTAGGLRPTHGCIRLSEDNQLALLNAVGATPLTALVVSVSEAPA